VVFEGAGAKPEWLSVAARLTSGPFRIFSTLFNGGANPDGALAIEGLPPGTYALDVRSGRTNPSWWPLSAVANGVDLLDTGLEIQRASLGDVVLTMTDTPAKLSGTIIGSDGAPMFRCSVVVFAADRRYWTAASRRVVAAVPDTSGSFEFVNLPPGDYLATAVVDWSLEGLSALVPKATPVTIRRGEAKTVRLQGLAR
jgi:hypothetical protein